MNPVNDGFYSSFLWWLFCINTASLLTCSWFGPVILDSIILRLLCPKRKTFVTVYRATLTSTSVIIISTVWVVITWLFQYSWKIRANFLSWTVLTLISTTHVVTIARPLSTPLRRVMEAWVEVCCGFANQLNGWFRGLIAVLEATIVDSLIYILFLLHLPQCRFFRVVELDLSAIWYFIVSSTDWRVWVLIVRRCPWHYKFLYLVRKYRCVVC